MDNFKYDHVCINDGEMCQCGICMENKLNGGTCTRCTGCAYGNRAMHCCVNFSSIQTTEQCKDAYDMVINNR